MVVYMYNEKKLADIWTFKGSRATSVLQKKKDIRIDFDGPLKPGWDNKTVIIFEDDCIPDEEEDELSNDLFEEEISQAFDTI